MSTKLQDYDAIKSDYNSNVSKWLNNQIDDLMNDYDLPVDYAGYILDDMKKRNIPEKDQQIILALTLAISEKYVERNK